MKRLLLSTTLVVLASPLAAQEITVAAANVAPWLDPARDHSNVGSQFYYNSFDTLIARDTTTTDLVWKPGLATEWTLIEPTVMELKLRQGVKFHDGSTMTADDVVFSLNRLFDATFPPYAMRAKETLQNFDRVEKVDDQTIRIHTFRAEPLWETMLNQQKLAVVPAAYVMGLSGDPKVAEDSDFEALALKPVGTGPYRIAEFVPGQRVVYERFDDFWGEPAPLERATVLHVPEVASRLTALRTGEADIATNIAPDQLEMIVGDTTVKAEGATTALFHVMILNENNPKLTPKIRQALMLAIDRDLLNEALWLGKSTVPGSHTMAEFGDLYMPELTTFKYDPDRAKTLLEEAGNDGFEITFDTNGSYYTNGLLAAQAITEMWAQVGINGRVNDLTEWTGASPDLMTRNWSNPMYFPDPVGSFGVMWAPDAASEGEGRFNTDEAYDAAWDRFRYSPEVADRKTAYAELMDMMAEKATVLPLYRPYESWVMNANVNWKPQPGHIPYVLDFRAGAISFAGN